MKPVHQKVDVVILAGGLNRVELFPGYEPGFKSLLSIGGRPCISYVIEALEEAGCAQRVCIVGPPDALRSVVEAGGHSLDFEYVEGKDDLVGSISAGLDHFAEDRMVLVLTADIPLLTAAAIRSFLDECSRADSAWEQNLFLSFVPDACYSGAYKQFTKNFNTFRDVSVCHGNLMLADPRITGNETAMQRINALYDTRKNPVLATLSVGLRVGLSYAFGVYATNTLTLQHMADIASWRFKLGIQPVLLPHPEVTIDIDEAKDYEFVMRQLDGGGGQV